MIKKILAALAAIGGVLSTVFFVLFKQAKLEQKNTKLENELKDEKRRADATEALRKAENASAKKACELEKEDEELVRKVHSDNNICSFDCGIDLLRRQAERGKERNNRTGNTES